MAIVEFVLDLSEPPQPTAQVTAAADGLTDAAITEAAQADPDNPPLTDDELDRIALARRVKRVRTDLGLSQEAFAARYGIPVATLRQWEMGRRAPDRATYSYLRVIAALPSRQPWHRLERTARSRRSDPVLPTRRSFSPVDTE